MDITHEMNTLEKNYIRGLISEQEYAIEQDMLINSQNRPLDEYRGYREPIYREDRETL